MTLEEIRLRIAQGEDSRTQFKRGPIGVSKLAAELAAFSNAEGGDIEKIKAGVSVVRNPLIFSFATREMPYRGLGTGVMRAIELGAKVAFVSDRELNVFKAVIRREPVNADETVNGPVNGPVNDDETVNGPVNGPVNGDETVKSADEDFAESVLRMIQAEPGIRRPDLIKRFNSSRTTVSRAIVALQATHKIEFRGAPKNGGYHCI